MNAPRSSGTPSRSAIVRTIVVVSAAALFGVSTPTGAFVLLCLLWVATFAVAFRRPIRIIFGPVFFHDLIRNTRRGSVVSFRCLYAVLLLVVLFFYYSSWAMDYGAAWSDILTGVALPCDVVSDFNNKFFLTFLVVQLVVVLLVTPVYAAGIVTEEKERRTLDYILATDVGDAEFVLGKLASRLASMALLLITGLPILALLQFLGGVDFSFLLAGFVLTLLTMLTTAGLSAALSVHSTRTISAVFGTYLICAFFLSGSFFLGARSGVSWGNPLIVLRQMSTSSASLWSKPGGWGGASSTELEGLLDHLKSFMLFNLFWSLLLCGWAVRHLRSTALQPQATAPKPNTGEHLSRREKPPVTDRPMFWKEIHAERHVLGSRSGRSRLAQLPSFLGWTVLIVYAVSVYLRLRDFPSYSTSRDIAESTDYFLRPLATCLMTTVLLLVMTVAAGKVSHERERRTLDGLLTSPLSMDEILTGKLVGALAAARPLGWAMLGLFGIGVATGGLHLFALPPLVAAIVGQSVFAATAGLWCSQTSRSTVHATLKALVVFLLMMAAAPLVVHWGETMATPWFPPAGRYAAFAGPLLTPWQSLLDLITSEVWPDNGRKLSSYAGAAYSSLLYGFLAILLWRRLRHRFDAEANRLVARGEASRGGERLSRQEKS